MNDAERAKFIKATFAQAFNAAVKGPHRCLYPECKSTAIASHSQQRGRELQAIAKHGHVYALTVDFASALGNHSPNIFTRQGIRKATTFPGFCANHDRELFRAIDVGILTPSEVFAATYGLRAMAHEAKRKLIMLLTYCGALPKLEGALGRSEWIDAMVDTVHGIELALGNEVLRYLDRFRSVALGAESNRVCFLWLTIGRNLGVSCTCAISLLFKLYEINVLTTPPDVEMDRPVVALSIVPEERRTHVVAVWSRDDDHHSEYIRRELGNTSDRAGVARFLNRLAFVESENATLNPDLWESLSADEQAHAVECLRVEHFRSLVPEERVPNIIQLNNESVSLVTFP